MAAVIRDQMGPFDSTWTQGPGDAVRIAREAVHAGRQLLISMGGDGTVSEVANGILSSGSTAHLGMLPGGTGSDYRKIHGLSPDLATAARQIQEGVTKTVDAGILEYLDHQGRPARRYFVNTASFGITGTIAHHANQSSKLLGGTLTYVVGTLRVLPKYRRPEIELEPDRAPARRRGILLGCVSVGPTFGGGMRIAPGAILDDGLLDVTLIGDLGTAEVLLHSYRLYTGSVYKLRKTEYFRTTRIRIDPTAPGEQVFLEVDGESPGMLPASMKVLPAALHICVPSGPDLVVK